MKLISVLDYLAATPADATPAPRRDLLAQLGRTAVAALPLGLGTVLPTAAGTLDSSYDATIQLFFVERLQAALYTQGLAAPGLIPAAQQAGFQRMLNQQTQHIALLEQALRNAGGIVPSLPAFDFSGRHGVSSNPELFPNVFTSFDAFLALAQQVEDLGVRLYTAHAFDFIYDAPLTRNVLRMLPVESQHAAHIRGLRQSRGAAVQHWPSEQDTTIPRPTAAQALTTAATGGEENTVQYLSAGVTIPFATLFSIGNNTAISDPSLAESFDEPANTLTAQTALNLFV